MKEGKSQKVDKRIKAMVAGYIVTIALLAALLKLTTPEMGTVSAILWGSSLPLIVLGCSIIFSLFMKAFIEGVEQRLQERKEEVKNNDKAHK